MRGNQHKNSGTMKHLNVVTSSKDLTSSPAMVPNQNRDSEMTDKELKAQTARKLNEIQDKAENQHKIFKSNQGNEGRKKHLLKINQSFWNLKTHLRNFKIQLKTLSTN